VIAADATSFFMSVLLGSKGTVAHYGERQRFEILGIVVTRQVLGGLLPMGSHSKATLSGIDDDCAMAMSAGGARPGEQYHFGLVPARQTFTGAISRIAP
jgi:hypothetical protein